MNITDLSLLANFQKQALEIAFRLSELEEEEYTVEDAIDELIELSREINDAMQFDQVTYREEAAGGATALCTNCDASKSLLLLDDDSYICENCAQIMSELGNEQDLG